MDNGQIEQTNGAAHMGDASTLILAAAERLVAEEAKALEQVSEAEALLHEAKNKLAAKRDEIARAFGILSARVGAAPAPAPAPVHGDADLTEVALPPRDGNMSKRARAWCQAQTGSFQAEHLKRAIPGMSLDYARTFLSTDRAMGFLRRVRRGRYAVKRVDAPAPTTTGGEERA